MMIARREGGGAYHHPIDDERRRRSLMRQLPRHERPSPPLLARHASMLPVPKARARALRHCLHEPHVARWAISAVVSGRLALRKVAKTIRVTSPLDA